MAARPDTSTLILDLDLDVLKLVLVDLPPTTCRLVCERFKSVSERNHDASVMLSQMGSVAMNETFLRKFCMLSIGSKYGWNRSDGWFAVILASMGSGVKLKQLTINATDQNVEELIEVLCHSISLNAACFEKLILHFEGSATQLLKCSHLLGELSSKSRVELHSRVVYDLAGGQTRALIKNFFDTLNASANLRALDLRCDS
jgi:hypothetical protein